MKGNGISVPKVYNKLQKSLGIRAKYRQLQGKLFENML